MPTAPRDDSSTSDRRADARKTVLVFGATGQQGGSVAEALLAAGWSVRAFVRDPNASKARALLSAGADVVQGDLSDSDAIRAAMADVHGVFSVQPSSGQGPAYDVTDEQEIRWGKHIADAAAAGGVRHLVYASVNAVGRGPTGMGHFDSKFAIEEHIRGLDLCSTVVRPAAFMELLLLPGMGLDQGSFSFFMHPEQAVQVIAVRDIGSIVAGIFAAPDRFGGRTLEIASDALTGAQLGEAFSRAAGKPISYRRFPDAMLDGNAFLSRLAALVDDGRLTGHADIGALRREFGGLTSFDAWLAGPGKPLLKRALQAEAAGLSLR